MRSVKQAVVSSLKGYAPLTAMVDDRIYHAMPPEEITLPCITYKQVSGTGDNADDRPLVARCRIQVDIRARVGVDEIADLTISAMGNIHGAVTLVNEVDMFDYNHMCPVHVCDFMVVAKI